ncbi:MAG TPA: XdhC family protein [Polyangiales bacterium]|nr:XdhC family protein [Polyangiales bacterium]
MSELRALIAAVRALREAREPFVSATVWSVEGSGYRKPGARMIATQDQWRAGSISGGCLERDVINKGLWWTRTEPVCSVKFDQSADEGEEGTGTGCQGVVDVLVERHERIDAADPFLAAERCLRDENIAVVLTVVRSKSVALGARLVLQAGALHTEHDELRGLFAHEAERALATTPLPYLASSGDVSVLVECVLPPVHLFVFGTGHDAAPLVLQAKQLGWSVSVWDASPRSSARERFQLADHYLTGSVQDAVARLARCVRGAAVVMGHHFARDRVATELLLRSRAPYVGVLGSRLRTQQLLEACRDHGLELDEDMKARLHAPVGLPLGAETPAEIALAIVAEIQRTFGRAPGSRP